MNVKDYIFYRIPGESIVMLSGQFFELKENQTPKGFVLSDFEGNQVYGFKEDHDGTFGQVVPPDETEYDEYIHVAQEFVKSLQKNGGKAVLSRVKRVNLTKQVDQLFQELCEVYPNAFVYTFLSTKLGCWIGATPETLVEVTGGKGKTMALAGTRLTGSSVVWTDKEIEEHEYVSDFIESTLNDSGVSKIRRDKRGVKISGPVEHLYTAFDFDIESDHVWSLAKNLHPTPAVCGWPYEESLNLILENEKHRRLFYAGIIGVVGEKSRLFVNLRCAQIAGNDMFLYLGGGFTKDSDPEAEWLETENKAKTLLDVLKKQ